MNGKIFFLLLFLILLGAGAWYISQQGKTGEQSKAVIVAAKHGNLDVVVTSTGELQAKNSTKIRGPQGSQVKEVERDTAITLSKLRDRIKELEFSIENKRKEVGINIYEPQEVQDRVQSELEKLQRDSRQGRCESQQGLVRKKQTIQKGERDPQNE